MKTLFTLFSILVLFLFGCHTHEHPHDSEIPSVSVTLWTDKMEIFMEYEQAIVDHEIKFIIHLTTLEDFQPVREGTVVLSFTDPSGNNKTVESDQLLREGIFTPLAQFDQALEYDFNIRFENNNVSETFAMGQFHVYDSLEDIPAEKESSVDEITFLKEQQWKIDFATELSQTRPIRSSVQAVGEVKPNPTHYAEIVSPVECIISITNADQLVKPGQKIRKGQTMAVLKPPIAVQNSWVDIYLNYDRAKAEFERAERLKKRQAISDREYEQAKRHFDTYKASFSTYFDPDKGSINFDSQDQQFHITAPINGIISEVTVLPGQKVDRGNKIFSIVDPDLVWLKFDLFSSQAADLKEVAGVSLSVPGHTEEVNLDRKDIKVISRGEIINRRTQTASLWLEADNRLRKLMIGQTLHAQIYTGIEQNQLAIPRSAIFEENMQNIVFVHSTGESFEKRTVITGPEYFDFIAILGGLEQGERIVTKGGYMVRLASTSEVIGHGHTH